MTTILFVLLQCLFQQLHNKEIQRYTIRCSKPPTCFGCFQSS